ncbi:MAG: fumarylacetoacetate hydrolase family protein [Verrucomicrobia bacterium]|nr:fumarylacetoacetate hydrolase family protein [Verrucomicrobiota bacterium]
MIRVYSTSAGTLLEASGRFLQPASPLAFDALFAVADPGVLVRGALATATPIAAPALRSLGEAGSASEWPLLAPLQSQEIWAAGVTYLRSKTARMAESKDAGGGTFYDKVYEAERPEIFFKATPHRVVGPGGAVRIRADSKWNVPEPELTLAINSAGKIFGYTIGNDMSSRDIEGENPLYLPQAKSYHRAAAIGPCLVVTDTLPASDTVIAIAIHRAGAAVFTGQTTVGQIKRPLPSLADWLFRENCFPHGCYLMTGVGVVPPDTFTLQHGDEIRITIEAVGTLVNSVD